MIAELESCERLERADLRRVAILLLIALVIGVYLIATTVLICKDGVSYIKQAQQFASDPSKGMKRHPPGYPFLILASHQITSLFSDSNSNQSWIYSAQSVSLLCRLLGLVVFYFMCKLFVGSDKAFVGSLILAFLPYPAEMGSEVLREWPHLLFLCGGLLFLIMAVNSGTRWFYFVCGLMGGVGFTIRPECAQVVLYAFAWLCLQIIHPSANGIRFKSILALLILMAGFCVPAVPYMKIRGRILPRRVEKLISVEQANVSEEVSEKEDVPDVYMCSVADIPKGTVKLFERVNENLMYVFALAGVIGVYSYFKERISTFYVFLVGSIILFNVLILHMLYNNNGYMSRRHCLPLTMILVVFVPDGLVILSEWLRRNVFKNSSLVHDGSNKLFMGLLVLGIVICLPKLLRPIGSGKDGYIAACEWLRENSEEDAMVVCPDMRISFYADRRGVPEPLRRPPRQAYYHVKVFENCDDAKQWLGDVPESMEEMYSVSIREEGRVIIYRVEGSI